MANIAHKGNETQDEDIMLSVFRGEGMDESTRFNKYASNTPLLDQARDEYGLASTTNTVATHPTSTRRWGSVRRKGLLRSLRVVFLAVCFIILFAWRDFVPIPTVVGDASFWAYPFSATWDTPVNKFQIFSSLLFWDLAYFIDYKWPDIGQLSLEFKMIAEVLAILLIAFLICGELWWISYFSRGRRYHDISDLLPPESIVWLILLFLAV
jgi:hypothetical protein